MKISVKMGSNSCQIEIIDGENALNSLGELRSVIGDKGNFDASGIKIIHRGKTLAGPDSTPLVEFNFVENDKLIVMGKPKKAMKIDQGYALLIKYEKDNLVKLQEQYAGITRDLEELNKEYLEEAKTREMIKKMDKRLNLFTEISLKHMENIDGLEVITEETSPEQTLLNREKRKSLIVGIQNLLNLNDKNARSLEELTRKLDDGY
ncbi:unnamed protein product [Auanema sp. JU1783]|nr:unnamed protein product [Auanema sp. JU1783]